MQAEPMIGALLGNRYRLDSPLGRGGTGTVYRAHDTLLDRDVAVKVLSAASLAEEGRARLLREALAEFDAMGAPLYAEQVQARLREVGGV